MEKNSVLRVSEKFFSIQGEGQTVGVPAIFLRLGGCNLLCKSRDWVCDSIAVWRNSTKIPFDEVLSEVDVKNLRDGAHLVITGGEPLLHQESVVWFLNWFIGKYDFKPIVEIETNGTIIPNYYLDGFVTYWNVSPKLINSGESTERRINNVALSWFNTNKKTGWKFVISHELDVKEIREDFSFIPFNSKMSFMPAGDSLESIAENQKLVVDLCKKCKVKFCPRLQITIYNQATGV